MHSFRAGYAAEEEMAAMIAELYRSTGYIIDTHTAVAAAVYQEYVNRTHDQTKTVIASTASPYKFVKSVMSALDSKYEDWEEKDMLEEFHKVSGVEIPAAIREILDAEVLHQKHCEVNQMEAVIREILKIEK